MNNAVKNFDILATSLSIQYNYFDPTKLFSVSSFLDTRAKSYVSMCIFRSKSTGIVK